MFAIRIWSGCLVIVLKELIGTYQFVDFESFCLYLFYDMLSDGFKIDCFRMLVYEYVDNGNLEQWLHGDVGPQSPLTWDVRMNIILGTAKG